jgi:hypothetical protein
MWTTALSVATIILIFSSSNLHSSSWFVLLASATDGHQSHNHHQHYENSSSTASVVSPRSLLRKDISAATEELVITPMIIPQNNHLHKEEITSDTPKELRAHHHDHHDHDHHHHHHHHHRVLMSGSDLDALPDDTPFMIGKHVYSSKKEFIDHGRCGTPTASVDRIIASKIEVENHMKHEHNKRRAQEIGTITIPVYLNVIHAEDRDRTGSITATQAIDQIQVLNEGFANTPFTFVLQNARMIASDAYFNCNQILGGEFKPLLRQGGSNALNLYTCAFSNGLLGYAVFPDEYESAPGVDGVVLERGTLPGGDADPYNLGDVSDVLSSFFCFNSNI